MSTYKVVWADDDWPESDTPRATGVGEDKVLEEAVAAIERDLRERGILIDWKKRARAAEALAELRGGDVRLVIVDHRFGNEYGWPLILEEARQRGVPFILYSRFLGDVGKSFPRDSPLFLGMYDKTTNEGQDQLVKRVVNFCRAPPFRLVHLSDLHYSARASGSEAEDQEAMMTALRGVLEDEQRSRPIDGIMITGDFAGRDPSFDLAGVRSHVNGIVSATIGSDPTRAHRLFVVPGNHDLIWSDFPNAVVSDAPWQSFLDFYQSIYPSRVDIYSRMSAWSKGNRLFDYRTHKDGLSWCTHASDLPISVIGLVSPTDTGVHQGRGEVTSEQLSLIRRWGAERSGFGEVRIGLIHHNLFKVLSFSKKDEKDLIINGGDTILALLRAGCHLVLSGHTHTTNLISFNAAHAGHDDCLVTSGAMTVLSAGTVGGYHGDRDRRRSFNILDFGAADGTTGHRALAINTFVYSSVERRWFPPRSPYFESWLYA